MKKTARRFLAMLLAVMMVLSNCSAAFAESVPDSAVTAEEEAGPELAAAEAALAEAVEPEAPEPEYAEPEAAEPETAEPEYTEPETEEPEYTEPEYTEPETEEPEYTEPEYTELEYTEPETAEPEYTEPEYTEPEYTDSENPDSEESPDPSDEGVDNSEETPETDEPGAGADEMPEPGVADSAAELITDENALKDETSDRQLESTTFDLGTSALVMTDDAEHAGAFVVSYGGEEYKNADASDITLTGSAEGNTAVIKTNRDITVRLENLHVNSAEPAITILGGGSVDIVLGGKNVLQSGEAAILISGEKRARILRSSNGGCLYAYSANSNAIYSGPISFDAPVSASGADGYAGIAGEITI